MKYYAQPTSSDTGVYLTSAEIQKKINRGVKKTLSNVKLGEIEKKLDFPLRIIHGVTKHHVKDFNMLISKRLNREKFLWKTVRRSNKQVEKWRSGVVFVTFIYIFAHVRIYILFYNFIKTSPLLHFST